MFKLKRQSEMSFTNIPSLVALFALLCSFSGLFLPYLYSSTQKAGWSLIHIFEYSYTSINIFIIVLMFIAMLLYFFNLFITPSWSSYFVCAACSVVLCVGPTIIYYTLANKLGLLHANLSLHAGAILMIASALTFAGLEIFRLGTIEKKMAHRLILKQEQCLKRVYYTKKSGYKADAILNQVAQNMAKEKGVEHNNQNNTANKKPRQNRSIPNKNKSNNLSKKQANNSNQNKQQSQKSNAIAKPKGN